MKKIYQLLRKNKVLISDGAWGTLLQSSGLKIGECPESWNMTNPEKVFNIAKNYIDAGSDIVGTNSFGGNRIKLNSFGLSSKCSDINKAASEISRKAAGSEKIVLGSIGPTGKILMMGDIKSEELYDVYKEQSTALINGGSDGILLETFTDLEELIIALKAVKENLDCFVGCTMTFDKTVTGEFRTMMGISPEDMFKQLSEFNIDIIGSNCGNGIDNMIDIAKEFTSIGFGVPIIIQANAGMPQLNENNETVFPEKPEEMASKIKELVKAGASIIGGCCGTTPEHILKIVEAKKSIT